jgi:hypothetical protein
MFVRALEGTPPRVVGDTHRGSTVRCAPAFLEAGLYLCEGIGTR